MEELMEEVITITESKDEAKELAVRMLLELTSTEEQMKSHDEQDDAVNNEEKEAMSEEEGCDEDNNNKASSRDDEIATKKLPEDDVIDEDTIEVQIDSHKNTIQHMEDEATENKADAEEQGEEIVVSSDHQTGDETSSETTESVESKVVGAANLCRRRDRSRGIPVGACVIKLLRSLRCRSDDCTI